jgi:hypothetical protein
MSGLPSMKPCHFEQIFCVVISAFMWQSVTACRRDRQPPHAVYRRHLSSPELRSTHRGSVVFSGSGRRRTSRQTVMIIWPLLSAIIVGAILVTVPFPLNSWAMPCTGVA